MALMPDIASASDWALVVLLVHPFAAVTVEIGMITSIDTTLYLPHFRRPGVDQQGTKQLQRLQVAPDGLDGPVAGTVPAAPALAESLEVVRSERLVGDWFGHSCHPEQGQCAGLSRRAGPQSAQQHFSNYLPWKRRAIPSLPILPGSAPGRSRTCNLMGRNHLLYPFELQGPSTEEDPCPDHLRPVTH
jgi:hypothetical protein